MELKYEIYKTDVIERPVERTVEHNGEKKSVMETVNLSAADRHRHTFRFTDETGKVIFSPLLRYEQPEHAERVAKRFAAYFAKHGKFNRLYDSKDIRKERSPIEFPAGPQYLWDQPNFLIHKEQ